MFFLYTSTVAVFLFAFPFSHWTLVVSLHRQFPGAVNCERKNLYPHFQIHARPFTHISMHTYCKNKKSLLRMSRQHHAHVDVIGMHLKKKKGWIERYHGCHVQAFKSQLFKAATLNYSNVPIRDRTGFYDSHLHIYSPFLSLSIHFRLHLWHWADILCQTDSKYCSIRSSRSSKKNYILQI